MEEKIKCETRSSGDGMETKCQNESSATVPIPVRRREPKFVPYEPYKAAVNPIVPSWNKGSKQHRPSELLETHIPFPLKSRSLDKKGDTVPVIRVLRRMHPEITTTLPISVIDSTEALECQKQEMEQEIMKLKEEKREIESQFKIQTKVNAELKKLLVASLGEDMQTKVQFLSEDKARLAQDIACYSQLIQEEHEELEKLAIQCDIWRSKFLASSMMVDELAQWKAILSHKYEEAKEAIQWLLQEHQDLGQSLTTTHRYLRQLRNAFDPSVNYRAKMAQKACNIVKLSQRNQKLGESVHFRLLGSTGVKVDAGLNSLSRSDDLTQAEEFAQKVLQSKEVMVPSLRSKEAMDSSWHFASGKSSCLFHPHFRSDQVTVNCCKHCSGEIDVI